MLRDIYASQRVKVWIAAVNPSPPLRETRFRAEETEFSVRATDPASAACGYGRLSIIPRAKNGTAPWITYSVDRAWLEPEDLKKLPRLHPLRTGLPGTAIEILRDEGAAFHFLTSTRKKVQEHSFHYDSEKPTGEREKRSTTVIEYSAV